MAHLLGMVMKPAKDQRPTTRPLLGLATHAHATKKASLPLRNTTRHFNDFIAPAKMQLLQHTNFLGTNIIEKSKKKDESTSLVVVVLIVNACTSVDVRVKDLFVSDSLGTTSTI
jgi:hypothetical protein